MAFENLDPADYMERIKEYSKDNPNPDEVTVRRLVSAAYFSVCNYLASEIYENGANNCRKESMNTNCLQKYILDCNYKLRGDWNTLYFSRMAVDHHLSNPAELEFEGTQTKMRIDGNRLKKVLKSAENIISKLNIKSGKK